MGPGEFGSPFLECNSNVLNHYTMVPIYYKCNDFYKSQKIQVVVLLGSKSRQINPNISKTIPKINKPIDPEAKQIIDKIIKKNPQSVFKQSSIISLYFLLTLNQ